MDPITVQEKQDTEGEKDRSDQEKKEVMEEDETGEKMEECEDIEKKKPEEYEGDEEMEKGEDEEAAEASMLEVAEDEEDGGEELDPQGAEKLLEEDEVGQDSHDGISSEEILRNFVKSDPYMNPGLDSQSFPDLTINSPKDNMSDDVNISHTLNSQSPVYDPYNSQISNESYFYQEDQPEYQLISSKAEPHDPDILGVEEEEMKEKEVEEVEQEKEQIKEDNMDEDVICDGEVTRDGGEVGLAGLQVTTKDYRTEYQEVIKAPRNPCPSELKTKPNTDTLYTHRF